MNTSDCFARTNLSMPSPKKLPARKSKLKWQLGELLVLLDPKGLIFLTYLELPENKEKKTNNPKENRPRTLPTRAKKWPLNTPARLRTFLRVKGMQMEMLRWHLSPVRWAKSQDLETFFWPGTLLEGLPSGTAPVVRESEPHLSKLHRHYALTTQSHSVTLSYR